MIQGHDSIRDAYRDGRVAEKYIDERFVEPLGALLHEQQRQALARLVASRRPRRVLELAPGPARLSVEIVPLLPHGVILVDTSAQMLAVARERLESRGARGGMLLQGDAFQLPLQEVFDLVYTFRLVRHFERSDRQRLYQQFRRVLRPGGVLSFDAVNRAAAESLASDPTRRHYDASHTAEELKGELEEAGFRNVVLIGVQWHYTSLVRIQVLVGPRSRPLARLLMNVVQRVPGGIPMEWVVQCERA